MSEDTYTAFVCTDASTVGSGYADVTVVPDGSTEDVRLFEADTAVPVGSDGGRAVAEATALLAGGGWQPVRGEEWGNCQDGTTFTIPVERS
ncbi:hypothetical protein [Streptomyces clavuligerus]|uniref:hypothetical protein n=1 Tax=Streptomyces clavuligerus TaxID=1901 RepID=UPI00020D92D1|nr:hypothetical protein [Streptomyces clavuligerus]WDN56022.1 hypothetical protein LL058_29500 [Streptomyces clavuligerus]